MPNWKKLLTATTAAGALALIPACAHDAESPVETSTRTESTSHNTTSSGVSGRGVMGTPGSGTLSNTPVEGRPSGSSTPYPGTGGSGAVDDGAYGRSTIIEEPNSTTLPPAPVQPAPDYDDTLTPAP